jgi:hypothetical protein
MQRSQKQKSFGLLRSLHDLSHFFHSPERFIPSHHHSPERFLSTFQQYISHYSMFESPVSTTFFFVMTTIRALAAQWLVVPELALVGSLYPNLEDDIEKFRLERWVHCTNMILFAALIFNYSKNPKLWEHMNYGYLLVILFLHHFFEYMTHEVRMCIAS